MTKSDMIQVLARTLGQRREAERAVESLLKAIKHALRNGDKVLLSGIGSLNPKLRKAQKRHNPKTLQPVQVPPKRSIKFVTSEELFQASTDL
jgi:nucleoid DNA-binding protein